MTCRRNSTRSCFRRRGLILQLPPHRRHRSRQRAWLRHRDRSGDESGQLLAVGRRRDGPRHSLPQQNSIRRSRRFREVRLHLGRQVVSLRYHAFRIPAGIDAARKYGRRIGAAQDQTEGPRLARRKRDSNAARGRRQAVQQVPVWVNFRRQMMSAATAAFADSRHECPRRLRQPGAHSLSVPGATKGAPALTARLRGALARRCGF
jgi:hypothetical protein